MDVNAYMAKTYSAQPCWELVADIYETELGQISVAYKTVNRSVREMAAAFRIAIHKSPHGFVQVAEPCDMCVVLLGTSGIGIHHCGVFCEGKVLHAMSGATLHEELTTLSSRYSIMEYWSRS
jgi:hypothetical protein